MKFWHDEARFWKFLFLRGVPANRLVTVPINIEVKTTSHPADYVVYVITL